MSEPIISAVETVLDNGKFGKRTVKFETGLLARQAAGSVTAYLDDETMLLSATTAGKTPKDHFDFFPLTIDVEERMYAVGQIPGSFFRSEGRPGEDAWRSSRASGWRSRATRSSSRPCSTWSSPVASPSPVTSPS